MSKVTIVLGRVGSVKTISGNADVISKSASSALCMLCSYKDMVHRGFRVTMSFISIKSNVICSAFNRNLPRWNLNMAAPSNVSIAVSST